MQEINCVKAGPSGGVSKVLVDPKEVSLLVGDKHSDSAWMKLAVVMSLHDNRFRR